jgi:nucleotide-binding universal stress UspA family protein
MWKTILVPHDFSPCAEAAVRLAAELAKTHGGRLALVHVSELPSSLPADTVIYPDGERGKPVRLDDYTTGASRRRLEAIAEPLRRAGVEVRTLAAVGDVERGVLSAAQETLADVLVVGTHGRHGLSHFVLGSVAEKLVRRSPIPVVTVRVAAPETDRTREERRADDELAG